MGPKVSKTPGTADFRTLSIGPVTMGGHSVRLRPPVIGDARQWRALRLRDRELIEPFWISTSQDWNSRHTDNRWIREVLASRRSARARRSLPMVVEVDGRFCGQCNLTAIDTEAREAELGIWLAGDVVGRSMSSLAGGLIMDYAFEELKLRRIIAPVSVNNTRAVNALRAAGFVREAEFPSFATTGAGEWIDHEVWALAPEPRPPGGWTGAARSREDRTVTHIAVGAICHSGSALRGLPLPHNLPELSSVIRFHVGLLVGLQRRRRPVQIAEGALAHGARAPGLSLRRVRMRDALWSSTRTPGSTTVIGPLRRGSWFDGENRTLAFHVVLHRVVVGRVELIGLNAHHRIAEAVVNVDREQADAEITGEAARMLIDLGRTSLDLHRIAGAIDPDDGFAAAVATAAGLHHQGRLVDAAVRDGVIGDVDVWSTAES